MVCANDFSGVMDQISQRPGTTENVTSAQSICLKLKQTAKELLHLGAEGTKAFLMSLHCWQHQASRLEHLEEGMDRPDLWGSIPAQVILKWAALKAPFQKGRLSVQKIAAEQRCLTEAASYAS